MSRYIPITRHRSSTTLNVHCGISTDGNYQLKMDGFLRCCCWRFVSCRSFVRRSSFVVRRSSFVVRRSFVVINGVVTVRRRSSAFVVVVRRRCHQHRRCSLWLNVVVSCRRRRRRCYHLPTLPSLLVHCSSLSSSCVGVWCYHRVCLSVFGCSWFAISFVAHARIFLAENKTTIAYKRVRIL